MGLELLVVQPEVRGGANLFLFLENKANNKIVNSFVLGMVLIYYISG